MVGRKATDVDYLDNDMDENFSRLSLTVEVKAHQIIVFGIRAKWFLIDWGGAGWTESKRHRYEEAGYYNINIVGESIVGVDFDGCGLIFLHFDRCDSLRRLRCRNNKLKGLDLKKCPSLSFVDCSRNELEYVQVGNLERLQEFKGSENKLEEVDFSGCCELRKVDLCYNEVKRVVIRGCRKLKHVLFDGALLDMKAAGRKDAPVCIVPGGN